MVEGRTVFADVDVGGDQVPQGTGPKYFEVLRPVTQLQFQGSLLAFGRHPLGGSEDCAVVIDRNINESAWDVEAFELKLEEPANLLGLGFLS